jgi:hypothetical protein
LKHRSNCPSITTTKQWNFHLLLFYNFHANDFMSLSSAWLNKHELHQSTTDATDYSILNFCAPQPETHH